MFEQFDELEQQNENEKGARENEPAYWGLLKDHMSQASGKRYKTEQFEWTDSSEGDAIMRLGEVAAQFIDEGKRDVAKKGHYRIRFGQRPLGPHEASIMFEYSYPEEWELKAGTLEGEFIWLVGNRRRVRPEDLAEEIAARLAGVYDDFEQAASL